MKDIKDTMEKKDWIGKLLTNAVQNRASDIHIDPERNELVIRFRVDGVLYVVEKWSKGLHEELVSRTKVLAQINITERRLPQDGHFEFAHKNKVYNIRVSTSPTAFGEAVALRILNRDDALIKLDGLGFDDSQLVIMRNLIASPNGMVLITGPSGTGKTTLLYSMLNTFDKVGQNIVTIEDPIEFELQGIRQAQINEAIGLTFLKATKTMLRQDPDIIMVGEIRDAETAQIAIQAALAGVLVFSTFHTLDMPGVVTRLIEMGIGRSVVAQAIIGTISARLIRKICNFCKEPYHLTVFERKVLNIEEQSHHFFKGKGCQSCRYSGYLDRTGIFEIVPFDDEIRTSIIEKMPFSSLHKVLRAKKIRSLKEVAIDRILQGVTTVDEIISVIGPSISASA